MKKVIIYWSGTGNTESIATLIQSDTMADLKRVSDISVLEASLYDVIILGCPAMGAEELEEDEFNPFYEELISGVSNKKFALFGSYDWGDGEWMRSWENDLILNGGELLTPGLIVNGDVSVIDSNCYEAFINAINQN